MAAHVIACDVISIAAWGHQFHSWSDLQHVLQGETIAVAPVTGPKPSIIPANERRRAPLSVRLAVETSWQACETAAIAMSDLRFVFASGLGDTQLTDYMCKVLASDHKQLSPTKFHNSVHNAPAGYWTISAEAMGAANSVAGFDKSVALTLMEGMIQCQHEQSPILLTFYDAPVSPILRPLLVNEQPFSFSMIIAPRGLAKYAVDKVLHSLSIAVAGHSVDWPELSVQNKALKQLYRDNPAAKILCLAELFLLSSPSKFEENSISMPLSDGTSLILTMNLGE